MRRDQLEQPPVESTTQSELSRLSEARQLIEALGERNQAERPGELVEAHRHTHLKGYM